MVNSNIIMESAEIIVTIIVVALSHFKGKSDIKNHLNRAIAEMPQVGTIGERVENTIKDMAPIVKEVDPTLAPAITLMEYIIDDIIRDIDEVTCVNYQEKAEFLRNKVEQTLKGFHLSNRENRLIQEHITAALNKKLKERKNITPAG